MEGDYSRDTFDAIKHFSRVIMQQGRVQLDADWNEQASIFLHYLRALAMDIIGPHGGPADNLGFAIAPRRVQTGQRSLEIGFGRYYVDGILCENEQPARINGINVKLAKPLLDYFKQPDYPLIDPAQSERDRLPAEALFVYLDVWERHITYVQDDSIREVALGGPDTAARTRTVWQVKVKPWDTLKDVPPPENITCDSASGVMNKLKSLLEPANRGWMAARAQVEDTDAIDVCIVSPEAQYRGAENQLYRVEIHKSGRAGEATFKWSRDAVVFPIQSLSGQIVTLENLGRDDRFGLEVGDWVEVVDDDYVLLGRAEPLLQVEAIDPIEGLVTLSSMPTDNVGSVQTKHPLLRRWDHRKGDPASGGLQLENGAALIVEDDKKWLDLEDGIQIRFRPTEASGGRQPYRTGDYWLIPARTVTGDIEWPGTPHDRPAAPPHGVEHHYAPLAVVFPEGDRVTDLRHSIEPIGRCCPKIEVLNPPTAPGPSATVKLQPIPFAVRVSGRNTDLKYRWSVTGGTITGVANTPSMTVAPADTSTAVIAVVVIEGLPGDCPNSAMGACAIVQETK